MILEAAAFLAIAGKCGLGVPPTILAGINRTESQYNTLAININVNGKGNTVHGIRTLEQAKAKARELIRQGKNFDAGIMQINRTNWEWLGLTVDSVFDPCKNIEAAARLLQSFGKYNAGSAARGIQNGYAGRTWRNTQAVSRETEAEAVAPASDEASCPLRKPSEVDGWGQVRWGAACRRVTLTMQRHASTQQNGNRAP